jgi:hypothetical protein
VNTKAKVVGIYANWSALEPSKRLIVELKPTPSTEASVQYYVNLYEKGNYRDSATLVWSQAQINVQSTQPVFFSLSDDEYEAYNEVLRWRTGVEDFGPVMRDLRDIFSAKVEDTSLTNGATEAISVTSLVGGCYTFGYVNSPEYYIEGTLSPTRLTQPDKVYTVFLTENPLIGKRLSLTPQTVIWSQRDIDLKETIKVRWYLPDDKAVLYNLDFYKECLVPTNSEERTYSDMIQKTIREHFTLSWR